MIRTLPRTLQAARRPGRRHAALLPAMLFALALGPALAQTTDDAAAEPSLPEPPALAPPPAALLPSRAAPSPPSAAAQGVIAAALPGLEPRGEGGWRLRFPDARTSVLTGVQPASLGELGRRLAALPSGRIIVVAQASAPATDVSVARRLSLERGIAVKQALVAGGLAETRIDIRPAGRTAEAADVVDVLPPAPPRTPAAATAASPGSSPR